MVNGNGMLILLDNFTYVSDGAAETVWFPWLRVPSEARSADLWIFCSSYQSGSVHFSLHTSTEPGGTTEDVSGPITLNALGYEGTTIRSGLCPLVRVGLAQLGGPPAAMTIKAYLFLKQS